MRRGVSPKGTLAVLGSALGPWIRTQHTLCRNSNRLRRFSEQSILARAPRILTSEGIWGSVASWGQDVGVRGLSGSAVQLDSLDQRRLNRNIMRQTRFVLLAKVVLQEVRGSPRRLCACWLQIYLAIYFFGFLPPFLTHPFAHFFKFSSL